MPQKILLISYNYSPELTGIGKYNAEFCEYLANKDGNIVTVITAYPYYPNWKLFDGYSNIGYKKERINGVNVIRCPFYIPENPTGIKRILQDFSFYISTLLVVLWQIVRCNRYDIVVTPSPSFMCGFHGLLLKLFRPSTKFVYHIQDLQIDAAIDLNIIKQGWLQKLLIDIERFILNRASVVSTISVGMQQKILAKQTQVKHVVLFPNWVDNSKIFVTKPNLSVIAELGIPLNKTIFFYSGAIGEKQGLEIILAVAPTIALSNQDILFVISGSGPYREKLKQTVINDGITNIMFIDLQPTEVFNLLLNYVYCHLIVQKGNVGDLLLPSKLTNILAVGGLSIISAVKETTLYNVIAEHNMGILIEPENEAVFTQAILNSIATRNNVETSIKETISANANAYAAKYLNKEMIIDRFIEEVGKA